MEKAIGAEQIWRGFRRSTTALAIYWISAGAIALLLSILLGLASALPDSGGPSADTKSYLALAAVLHAVPALGLLYAGSQLLRPKYGAFTIGVWTNYALIFACLSVLNALLAVVAIPAAFKAWSLRQQIGRIRHQDLRPEMSSHELREQLATDLTLPDRIEAAQFD